LAEHGIGTRRAPLNRERVLSAAVDLADREGIAAVSMRRVGQELGVEAMSLYNHVANKEALLDGMIDTVVAEIDPLIDDSDWRKVYRARVLSARQMLLRHPWATEVLATRRQMSPLILEYFDSMAAVLRNGGLPDSLAHHAMHTLGSRTLGFTQELYPSDVSDEDPAAVAAMIAQLAQAYPNVAAMAAQASHDDSTVVGTSGGCDDQYEFEFGLDLILNGLEQMRLAADG
jgi:AcrR family transcriptional regulator